MNLYTCLLFLLFAVVTVCSKVPERCPRFKTDRKYTVVEYYGRLHCSRKATWCAMIYYMEHDKLTFNEDEQIIPVRCTKNHTLTHHAYVQFNGGDGEDDQYYEPRIEILHDCNKEGFGQYEVDLKQVDIGYNVDYLDYFVEVAHQGATTERRRKTDYRYKDWINHDTNDADDFMLGKTKQLHKYPWIFEPYDENIRIC